MIFLKTTAALSKQMSITTDLMEFPQKSSRSFFIEEVFRGDIKKRVLRVGRVGTHIFLIIAFFWKINIILCILKGIWPFKMHNIIFFYREPEQSLGFTGKFR